MAVREITKGVYFVGAMHWDRRLFDELIPLPDGTSYNSYIVRGSEKTALIDAVDPATISQLEENLKKLGIKKLDYVVSNHAEQDHSGGITWVLQEFPGTKVVTNEKCKSMLMDLLPIPEKDFVVIKEGDTLALGGKTLEFYMTPWVHWPETQSAFLKEDGVLFSCDFFGAHMATADIFDAEHFYRPAKRYFAEIMSPFRNNVRNNLQKVGKLDIKVICPSHGYIHKNPKPIMDAYGEWSSENVKNEAVLAYVSMHDSTKKMAEYLREALIERGVNVHFFNLTSADVGDLAMCLVDSATLILGAPTVLAGLHPVAASTAYLANALRPKTKFISLITSFGWGEKASETVKGMLGNFKAELLAPVIAKGYPKEADFKELDRLADEVAAKHKELGLIK
ncbi:MAG TPA: FprA family A-type flavoprotein [Candidatus Goldiibacteriota bacterium]|nr:FprA family A-type flavoprotein [Candidatus Goldiibacteriota bacterium]